MQYGAEERRLEEEDEHHGDSNASAPHTATLQLLRRSKKRRLEEEADEHHGEFDANALREHEEFTKVKNVEMVELGRHTMETWYFSPLPAEYSNCKARVYQSSALRSRTWRWWSWGATPWRPGTSRPCRPSTATARRASTSLVACPGTSRPCRPSTASVRRVFSFLAQECPVSMRAACDTQAWAACCPEQHVCVALTGTKLSPNS